MARSGPVRLAVRRDLAGLADAARKSGLAASALALAGLLDSSPLLTARDAASVAAELRQTLAELRRQYPVVARQEDEVDKVRARRAARRAAG